LLDFADISKPVPYDGFLKKVETCSFFWTSSCLKMYL